jgi:multicomponent Na+:H+ antiporter subunit F
MTVVAWTTVAILVAAAVLGLIRLVTARDEASAAAVADLVYFCAVGIFVMVAMVTDLSVIFDVASISALLGILATVALARILTRGRR